MSAASPEITTQTVALAAVGIPRRRRSWARDNSGLIVALSALGAIVLTVLFLPFALPDPNAPDAVNRLLPPSTDHLLGTDNYGRDVWSRLVSGGRASLGLAAVVTLAATVLGAVLGLLSGYFRRIDSPIMRLMDAAMAFPGIVLAMALAIAMGASALSEFIALTVVFIPSTARVIRSRVLGLVTRDFVMAAKASGMSAWKIILTHIVPHTLPLMLVQFVIIAALAMLIDGGLSYLGLGIAPPTPTWGNMIAEGRAYMAVAPHLILVPGLAIVLCVALLNLAGDAMRPIADSESRILRNLQRLRAQLGKSRHTGGGQQRRAANDARETPTMRKDDDVLA